MDKLNINGFIKWIEDNKNEETGEYRRPRISIKKEGKTLNSNEMTEKEKEECKWGRWWSENPIKTTIVKEYFEWIKNHRYEITGIHKIPRTRISKDGRPLSKEEMSTDEQEEVRIGKGFAGDLKLRSIIEEYAYVNIENVPKEYREMIEIIKSASAFSMYIEWRKNHFDEETQTYKKPRVVITRNGKRVKPEEMTFEEKEELEIVYIWRNQSEERRIINRYKGKSICEIPENYIKMIEEYRKIDENLQDNEIDEEIARIKSCTQDYINRNSSRIKMNREIARSYINRRETEEEER